MKLSLNSWHLLYCGLLLVLSHFPQSLWVWLRSTDDVISIINYFPPLRSICGIYIKNCNCVVFLWNCKKNKKLIMIKKKDHPHLQQHVWLCGLCLTSWVQQNQAALFLLLLLLSVYRRTVPSPTVSECVSYIWRVPECVLPLWVGYHLRLPERVFLLASF